MNILKVTNAVNLIRENCYQIVNFINNNHFIVNIDLLEMIKSKSCVSLSNRTPSRQILNYQTHSSIDQQDISILLRNIQQAIMCQYNILGQIVSSQSKQNIKTSIKQLQQSIIKLKKYKRRKEFQKQKNRVIDLFKKFMRGQMINQYLYFIRFMLTLLHSMSLLGQYHDVLFQKWRKYQNEIKKTGQLKLFQQKDYHIKKLKQSRVGFFYESSQSQASNKKKYKSQSVGSLMSSLNNSQSGEYVKFYTTEIQTTNFFVRHIIYLKYVLMEQGEASRKLLAIRKQYQMNVLRYCQKQQLQQIMKFKIVIDEHTQNKDLFSQLERKQTVCFQINSQKGDKDYSNLYNQKNRQSQRIKKQTLWDFNNKKTIYSFLKCFALIIQKLEQHSMHQTDFQFQNFIKFGNIFQLIDLEAVFFVKSNEKSKCFHQLNDKMFECWLNSSLTEQLSALTATCKEYEKIRQRFYMDGSLGNAIQKCNEIMEDHMKINHYNQFYELCKQLLSFDLQKQSGLFSKQEINKILAIIPYNKENLNFNYSQFINELQILYKQFNGSKNKQIYPIESICKQYTKLSSFIDDYELVNVFKDKILSFINLMQLVPFNNICKYYSYQTQSNIWLCSYDNNRKLSFQKCRYVILYLKSLISLIKQLQSKQFIILNLGPQLFVQYGQKFILKNLAYIFKIKKRNSIVFMQQQSIQMQLIDYSYKSLCMFVEKDGNLKQDKKLFAEIQILLKSINNPQVNFSEDNIKEIHFTQFKKIAQSLLTNNNEISKFMDIVNKKDKNNYFTLQSQLPQLTGYSY